MGAFLDHLAPIGRGLAATPLAVLPARLWRRFPALPIEAAALPSATLTMLGGIALGIRGFFEYSGTAARIAAAQTMAIAEQQLQGRQPVDPSLNVTPFMLSALTPLAFAFFTPAGLAATYLAVSGFVRVASCVTLSPIGDPLFTLGDGLWRRASVRVAARRTHRARAQAEGREVPDRLYEGAWAGLPQADFVVVSSRAKPGWEPGTFVITPDGWFTLGVPFDLRLPGGLRTVYPLTAQTTNEVLRRSVTYELPPLQTTRAAPAMPSARPPRSPSGPAGR